MKAKVLELIQVWSHAFRNESSYKVVQETYNDMKREGALLHCYELMILETKQCQIIVSKVAM